MEKAIVEKGENAGNQYFLFFSRFLLYEAITMFSDALFVCKYFQFRQG